MIENRWLRWFAAIMLWPWHKGLYTKPKPERKGWFR